MSFPDRIVPGRIEDPSAIGPSAGPNVLQDSRSSHMLQVVAQLIDVRKFAQEIFQGLHEEAIQTSKRIEDVRQRMYTVQKQVPVVEDMFHHYSPASFVMSPLKHPLKRETNTKGGFFIRNSAPHAVDRRRDVAQKWPDLNKLNRFQKCLDTKAENLFCLDKYTNPRFFFDMWLKGEQERLEKEKAARKKRRKAKGKRKKNKGSKKTQTVQKVKRKRIDEFGNAYWVEVGSSTETEEYKINVQEGTAKTLTYGTAVEYDNITHHTSTSGSPGDVYQPAAYTQTPPPNYQTAQLMPHHHQAPPPTLGKGPGSVDPPSMSNFNAPPPGIPSGRSPPSHPPTTPVDTSIAQGSSRPPAHHPQQPPRQPPAHHHQQPPRQPPSHQPHHPPPQQPMARAPPVQPQKPAIPDYLAPYARMKKMRVPEPGIKNKMRQNGIDPALYDQFLADGAPGGAAPGSGAPPSQPAAHRPPPGPSRGGLLGAIQQGRTLNRAADRQMAPPPAKTGRGGMMDAIRAGAQLSSAKERKLKPKKVEVSVRDQTLNAITRGVKLKKAGKQITKKEAQEDANSIFALMKMRQLLQDSDDEDDDEEWSS